MRLQLFWTVCVLSAVCILACEDAADEANVFGQPDVSRSLSDARLGLGPDATLIVADMMHSTSDASSPQIQDAGADVDRDAMAVQTDGSVPVGADECSAEQRIDGECIADVNEYDATLCDGFDNDCDGVVDEGCGCKPGRVQTCFLGPANQVDIGACQTGTMRCIGEGETGTFGPCDSVGPTAETCDGLDNNCNGCVDETVLCDLDGQCPGPGDPRTPAGRPFVDYPLLGALFYQGEATSWRWEIQGGPCDQYAGTNTGYELLNATSETALFKPRLSGSYRVTLTVTTPDGDFICSWVIDVLGPGLRVEMCYPESNTQDLDLYMMPTSRAEPWFPEASNSVFGGISLGGVSQNACSWYNCEAELRALFMPRRVDWGHGNSSLSECEGGPQGDRWRNLGFCSNPRLDIDNNLSEGTGLPENINLDVPTDGEGYRIMIQNVSGTIARPIVNVYCGGRLKATYGAPPDIVPNFSGRRGDSGVGAMWRVAEVYPDVSVDGVTTDCRVDALHPAGQTSGYLVTTDDRSF